MSLVTTKWGVTRPDLTAIEGKEVHYEFDKEIEAREWYRSGLEMAKANLPRDPELWPQLIKAELNWEVVA